MAKTYECPNRNSNKYASKLDLLYKPTLKHSSIQKKNWLSTESAVEGPVNDIREQ